ncbi:two-component system, unclassified family, response regulator [Halogranum rubrum]|uniref:Two-component system, unclassified family, response regulator n=1 Tax=Halogranum rubrum TaxID=553466 RepID=A0A1I4IJF2_9EURY|nr:response regulator [Halogranum rubrum]SFL54460.1 two-component system, unclassified family, response regulator [Halogranum rubrum]
MSTTTPSQSTREQPEVLLVEDDLATSRLVEEAFAEVNEMTSLHVTQDGVDALDFLYQRGNHASAPKPNLVLLDLGLPRKNGKSVLKELKETATLSHIPVVVFSDSTAEQDVDDAYTLGANAYVTKPGHFPDILTVVEDINDFWLTAVRQPQ